MAKIEIENINQLLLNVIPFERKYNSKGNLAVHPAIHLKYITRDYHHAPQSRKERDKRGLKGGWNGMESSFPSIRIYQEEGETIVIADVAPTRYLIGQAFRDLSQEENIEHNVLPGFNNSPNMANVSLIAPIKFSRKYYLLAQIKGDTLGTGQIHSALVAGGIKAKYLSRPNPLIAALQKECSKEIKINLNHLNPSSIVYIVDEREIGKVNFAHIAKGTDLDTILESYEADVKEKLINQEKLEVDGLALIPIENKTGKLRKIRCFLPTKNGLTIKMEKREIRPYTQATLDYLQKPENVRFLLEKAGF